LPFQAEGRGLNQQLACLRTSAYVFQPNEPLGDSRPIEVIEVGEFVLARSEFNPDGPFFVPAQKAFVPAGTLKRVTSSPATRAS
jgi:hypothetical protein